MEAIERLTARYPELQSLSSVLADFENNVITGEQEKPAYMTEAQQNVTLEMADFYALVDILEPDAGKLRQDLASAPLDSIRGLHSYFQAEVQNGSKLAQVDDADALSEGLLSMLSAGTGGNNWSTTAPASAEGNLQKWADEFVYGPMAELSAYSQQHAQLLDSVSSRELDLLKQVQKMSELIGVPGFSQHRVELKTQRLELAHKLVGLLKERHLTIVSTQSKRCNFLARKIDDFKEVYAARLQEHRNAMIQHKTIAEEIRGHVDSVAKYAVQKVQKDTDSGEHDFAAARRRQRAVKVRRVSNVLREAFAGIDEIIRECHADQALIGRIELERRLAMQGSEDLQGRFDMLGALHASASKIAEEMLAIDSKFSEWLQELYSRIKAKSEEEVAKLELPVNDARLRALSTTVTDQIRIERESMQGALQSTEKRVNECQEVMAALEYNQPSETDIANHVDRFQRAQEVAKWQLEKIDMLTRLEEDLTQNGLDSRCSDKAGATDAPREDQAETWVRALFCSDDNSGRQPNQPVPVAAENGFPAFSAEAQRCSSRERSLTERQAQRCSSRERSLTERLAQALHRNSMYLAHTQASLGSRPSTPRCVSQFVINSRPQTPRRIASSSVSLQADSRTSTKSSIPSMPSFPGRSQPGGDTQLGSIYVTPGQQLSWLQNQPERVPGGSSGVNATSAHTRSDDGSPSPLKARVRSSSLGRSWQKAPGIRHAVQAAQGYPVGQAAANPVHPVKILFQAKAAGFSGASTPSLPTTAATPSLPTTPTKPTTSLSVGVSPLVSRNTSLGSSPLSLTPIQQMQANAGDCAFIGPGRAGVLPVRAVVRSASVGCLPRQRHSEEDKS